jgi:hypothetical protein
MEAPSGCAFRLPRSACYGLRRPTEPEEWSGGQAWRFRLSRRRICNFPASPAQAETPTFASLRLPLPTSAQPTVLAASTAVRCCFKRPGFWRLARIRSMRKGWPVTRDSANDVRRIWPPPSPCDPSIVIISVFRPLTMRGHLHQLRIELAEDGHEVLLGGHDFMDVLVNHRYLVQTSRD